MNGNAVEEREGTVSMPTTKQELKEYLGINVAPAHAPAATATATSTPVAPPVLFEPAESSWADLNGPSKGARELVLEATDLFSYTSTLTLPEEGQWEISVQLWGQHVTGSPFRFFSLCWDASPANLSVGFVITEAGRTATYRGLITTAISSYMPVLSTAPTEDCSFTVRSSSNNYVMVGLINRAAYIKDRNHQHCQGNYSLYLKDGSLFGSSKSYSGYSQQSIPVGSVVRAVRDRLAGTISFFVNGISKGVAFHNVPATDDLYAYAEMNQSAIIELF